MIAHMVEMIERKTARHLLAERMFHQLDSFIVVDLMMDQWQLLWERCLSVVSIPVDYIPLREVC